MKKVIEPILKGGEYEAVLWKVQDKVSHRGWGNPMWVPHWEVLYPSELSFGEMRVHTIESVKIVDYIVKSKPWKLEQIARAWSRLPEFEGGRFDLRDHLEEHLTIVLDVETQMGFPQRNVTKGYKPLRSQPC